MRFFCAVELPEWCYLSEAVHFLAFGKVPEVIWYDTPIPDERGSPVGIDARFYWKEMPDNFENNLISFDFYEPEDFAAAGLDMPKGYGEAASSILWGQIWDAYHTLKFHEEYFDRIDWEPLERTTQLNKYKAAKKVVSEAGPKEILFEETNALFEIHLEKVWGQLFSGIHSGDLVIEAVHLERWDALSAADEYEKAGEFEKVPAEAFRLAHDFKQDELTFGQRTFVATRVNTQQLITFWGSRFQMGESLTARSFGHALVLEDGTLDSVGSTPSKRSRGAPFALDWKKMEARLEEMHQLGSLPSKKDACIQELIEHAQKVLGRRVGRTTVQTRLKHSLDRHYARN